MKNCSSCEDNRPGCDENCAECSYHFPPVEEMVSEDKKENIKNVVFLGILGAAMIAFVILCGTLLNHFTGGKVTETGTAQSVYTQTAYEEQGRMRFL